MFAVKFSPYVVAKGTASIILAFIAMHYLVTGRRQANFGRMVTGALLALASVFLFV